MKKFFVGVFLLVLFLSFLIMVKADELDDINNAINSLKKDLSNKEIDYQSLNIRLNGIKSKLSSLEQAINQKEIEVKKGEQVLSYQKELLNERAKSYYKNVNKNSSLFLSVLVSDDLSASLRKIFYQKSLVDEDKRTIIKIVLYVKNLEEIKKNLETEKLELARLKLEVDKQSQIITKEIAGKKQEIATLTARQQQLIASRIAGLNLSRSAGAAIECVDDRKLDPGFGPGFAFYTYGIPHRVGLNQYGAKGRADSGQSYETILRAYYNFDNLQKFDTNIKIKVEGQGEFSLEDYALRIYEIPESWPIEALKAQVIAARSFALRYIEDRRSAGQSDEICTSQSCQVFQSNPKTGQWAQAVRDTEGLTMIQGGQPIKAWFASTFGGYTHTSAEVWGGSTSWTKNFADTSLGVNSFSDLQSNAWDKESKCFYTAQGSRGEYGKSAWLRPSEVADIANTLLLVKNDSSTTDNLYQVDKSNPAGKENWSSDKVKSMLSNPFNNVTDVRITGADFGSGKTTEITIVEGGREERFAGDEFKNRFNLRAPKNISIVGPLFNIEKR